MRLRLSSSFEVSSGMCFPPLPPQLNGAHGFVGNGRSIHGGFRG